MEDRLQLRDEALEWREVDGEVLALDGRLAQYMAANGSGAVLWALLAQGTTASALIGALVSRYDIDRETAAADVQRFLSQLREHRLLAE